MRQAFLTFTKLSITRFGLSKSRLKFYEGLFIIATFIGVMMPSLFAQNVGIGTATPHPKALVHLEDRTRGFLFTRMTTAERDTMTNLPNGLTIYNLTTNCLEVWNGTKWFSLCDDAGSTCNEFQCTTPNTWNSLTTPPATIPTRNNQVAAAYNGKIYMGLGDAGTFYKDWWAYDVCTGTWTQLADFPGTARSLAFAFVLNGKIYVGGGEDLAGTYYSDVYAYDPATNSWSAKASLPSARGGASGTANDQYGFIFGGRNNSTYLGEVLRYDPATDTWSLIANYPMPGGRWSGIITAVGNRLYMGTGKNALSETNDFFQYDLTTNTWSSLAFHPLYIYDGWAIYEPTRNRIYVLGNHLPGGGCTNQFFSYDIATNSWSTIATFSGGNRNNLIGAYWNGVIYVGFGYDCIGNYPRDWWAYCPN